ncbi:MAG TPA: hypothetical protein VJ806_08045 [Luteimonas sp.]|nr:hypothetical protein [Luteimonas sp.]
MHIVRFEKSRTQHRTYQLRAIRPKLLSIDDERVRWLQVGPDLGYHAGDRVQLIELDLAAGRTVELAAIDLPFDGWLMQIDRGEGCTVVRAERGLRDAALLVAQGADLTLTEAKNAERVMFWDSPSSGFVVGVVGAPAARAIDCRGRAVPVSAAARGVLSAPRHRFDRFFSAPEAHAIAIQPFRDGTKASLLFARAGKAGVPVYQAEPTLDAVRGLASSAAGDRVAVLGNSSVDVVAPGGKRRVLDISTIRSSGKQTIFLERRPVLAVLGNLGVTLFDTED